MPILAMGLTRVSYIQKIEYVANSVRDHIIKVLVVEDFFNTKKWLKDAENALVANLNHSTKVPLKLSDFQLVCNILSLEPHNVCFTMNRIFDTYKNRVTIRHVDTESLAVDVNDIINEQVEIFQSLRLQGKDYKTGSLKNSDVVKQKINEYSTLDSFLVNSEKDAKRVIKNIMSYGEIG